MQGLSTAYCNRKGIVGIADGLHFPDECLPLVVGPYRRLRHVIECASTVRQHHAGDLYVVPGVSDRDPDYVAYTAIQKFTAILLTRDGTMRRWPTKGFK